MRITLLLSLLAALTAVPELSAQTLAAETEVVVDGKGTLSAVQVGMIDWEHSHVLARYIWVNDELMQTDLSIGPVVRIGGLILKPYAGVDTGSHLILGTLLSGRAGYGWFYFGEARISPESQTMAYHRLSGAVVQDGRWQVRIEAVQAGMHLEGLTIGVERNISIGKRSKIFLAPSFDCVRRTGGFAFGFRVE